MQTSVRLDPLRVVLITPLAPAVVREGASGFAKCRRVELRRAATGWLAMGGVDHDRRARPSTRGVREGDLGEAFARFSAADAEQPLVAEDLERLAVAAQLVGEDERCAAAWERAHLQLLERGQVERAVGCAFWLASQPPESRADGARRWLGRPCPAAGPRSRARLRRTGLSPDPAGATGAEEGDPAQAHDTFAAALAVGQRFGEADLVTLGRLGQGRSLIVMGRDAEGLALLDEAMVAVTAKEVTPIVAGRVYCAVILVCQQAFDWNRAHEWTAALSDWCDAQPDMVLFRGQCLVHRSEVMQWHGEWPKALDEAKRARDRLSDPPGQPAVGMAVCQPGELYRLRGEFVEAEAAYREASHHGRAPQPGLSYLRMMQGDIDGAGAAIRRIMSERCDRMTRAKVLSACVEIMLAAGDAGAAAEAATELAAVAADVDAPVLHAMAMQAAATLSLHRGDPRAALDAAQEATSGWANLEAPYEQPGRGCSGRWPAATSAIEIPPTSRPTPPGRRSNGWVRCPTWTS